MLKGFKLIPEQASTMASQVDALTLFLTAITLFFTILIAVLIVAFMIRFRRRKPDERGADVHGSLALEIGWTVVPFIIVMSIFVWSASIYAKIKRPPANAVNVNVVGKQWMWKVQHMEGRREINQLHVPTGQAIKLTLTSEDVIHSFYVPAFRIKQDAVPGRYTEIWFEATKPGHYHLFCAEYCGTIHAGMIGEVIVMEPTEYQDWLETPPAVLAATAGGGAGGAAGGTGGGAQQTPADLGKALFTAKGCATCHAVAGGLGPQLGGLIGKTVSFQDGSSTVADEGYVRDSILNPQARVVAGFPPVMPTFQGQLSEENLMDLIAYIKTLPPEGGTK
jgi:cytochrome c oxidase subunit 2